MAQFRMMIFLLFVCPSLACTVVPSGLKCMGSPCTTSDECDSRCCVKEFPGGRGKCDLRLFHGKCFGGDNGEYCYYSHECSSKCCSAKDPMDIPRCVEAKPGVQCYGEEDGNLCYSSEGCKSKCCYKRYFHGTVPECVSNVVPQKCMGREEGEFCYRNEFCNSGCCRWTQHQFHAQCEANAAEDDYCSTTEYYGKYNDCPCASGFECKDIGTNTGIGTCKKPKSGNHHCT